MNRPAVEWKFLRLPAEVHARLAAMAAEVQAAHVAGRIALPPEHADKVPLHHVITRLLDEVEARRARSRRPRKPRPAPGGDVYTAPPGTPTRSGRRD